MIGNNLVVEAAGLLGGGGAHLRLQAVFVLGLTADAIAVGDGFRGVDHRHVQVRVHLDHARIGVAELVRMLVLNEADLLQATGHDRTHIVVDDLLGGGRDRHQAAGALTVDAHAGNAGRQTACETRLAADIVAGRALLQRRAHDAVVDLSGVDAGPLDGSADRIAGHGRRFEVVESTAIGFADRGTRSGNNRCFTHGAYPCFKLNCGGSAQLRFVCKEICAGARFSLRSGPS